MVKTCGASTKMSGDAVEHLFIVFSDSNTANCSLSGSNIFCIFSIFREIKHTKCRATVVSRVARSHWVSWDTAGRKSGGSAR